MVSRPLLLRKEAGGGEPVRDYQLFLAWKNMTPVAGMVAVGTVLTALSAVAGWASVAPKYRRFRIRTSVSDTLGPHKFIRIALNGALSVGLYAACIIAGDGILYHAGGTTILRVCAETLGVLLLYDCMYYFMHRALHVRMLMKLIHGVHHRVRFAEAMDGLYVHPAEMIAGMALLFAAMAILGPVSTPSLLLVVFLHSVANIATHTNLVLPHPVFAIANFWAIRHDHHHASHRNANFASIFPVWDLMFRTYK